MSRPSPTGVRVIDLDIPFLSLTWFFVKASLAMSFAVALTSWIWVVVGSGMVTLSAALVVGLGVPSWFHPPPTAPVASPTPVAAPAPVAAAVEVAPAPVAAPPPASPSEPVQPAEPWAALPAGDPNREATEAAMRAEIERHRRERKP